MTDTHDTNLPDKAVELEEDKKTAEVSEPATTETSAEATLTDKPAESVQKLTKEEILNKLKGIATDVENAAKSEIDSLKQAFYKLHNSEQEAAKKLFVENGGIIEEFVPQADALEEEFKNTMSVIKEKRSALNAEQEKQKELNLQIKLSIIEELKELVESPEDANKNYTEFKKLQQQWNEVKVVPQANNTVMPIYIIIPIMSLVMEINGPVAIAGSTFSFSSVIGTSVPNMEANITTANRLMDTE